MDKQQIIEMHIPLMEKIGTLINVESEKIGLFEDYGLQTSVFHFIYFTQFLKETADVLIQCRECAAKKDNWPVVKSITDAINACNEIYGMSAKFTDFLLNGVVATLSEKENGND